MKKHITIGVAGHVDHGKTALVRCLTGFDTDRLQEEKRRGLSIESGVAPFKLPSGEQVALVDIPGHTDFFKNAIRGLSCIDMVILVVAADDGVMPQTQEHLEILKFLRIKNGFIVLSKADLVDDETLELAELEIVDIIKNTFLEGKPILPFSAIDRKGLEDVRRNIGVEVERTAEKNVMAPFRLWVDQVKSFSGFGTVATGTIRSGIVKKDDIICLLPSGKETRVRFIEVHHKKIPEAAAGERAGINLHKVPLKEVKRGMVLAKQGSVKPSYLLNVELKVLKDSLKPILNRHRIKLYLGTSVTNTMVVLMDKELLEPGEKGLVQFRLMKQVAALPGDLFVICPLNVQTIIGGGEILEIPQEKYRQVKAPKIIPYMKALQKKDLKTVVEHLFNNNLNRLVTSGDIARSTGFSPVELEAEMKARVKGGQLLYFKGRGFLAKTRYQSLKNRLPEIVEKILTQDPLKLNATAEEIKKQLAPFLDDAPFQRMLTELCNEGKLIKTNGNFQVSNLSVRLSEERERLINLILDYAERSGFVPFSASTFWKFYKRKTTINEIQRLLDYLHNTKRLICLNNRRFISIEAMEQIKDRVKKIIEKNGKLAVGDCKEVLGYGRTVGLSVFEYLDSIEFTRRQGNERVLMTD
jgi:selenocysteine-specific elongation factor